MIFVLEYYFFQSRQEFSPDGFLTVKKNNHYRASGTKVPTRRKYSFPRPWERKKGEGVFVPSFFPCLKTIFY